MLGYGCGNSIDLWYKNDGLKVDLKSFWEFLSFHHSVVRDCYFWYEYYFYRIQQLISSKINKVCNQQRILKNDWWEIIENYLNLSANLA